MVLLLLDVVLLVLTLVPQWVLPVVLVYLLLVLILHKEGLYLLDLCLLVFVVVPTVGLCLLVVLGICPLVLYLPVLFLLVVPCLLAKYLRAFEETFRLDSNPQWAVPVVLFLLVLGVNL
jgi:hypothetical protein